MPNIRDVDAMLEKIASNPERLERCNNEATKIREKRQKRYLRLSGQVNILQRNRTLAQPNALAASSIGFPGGFRTMMANTIGNLGTVADMRVKRENGELMRKFLLSHRWEIIKNNVSTRWTIILR